MRKKYMLFITVMAILLISCNHKTKNRVYLSSDIIDISSSILPNITLFNDNSFKFELTINESIHGAYKEDSEYIYLTQDDNDKEIRLKLKNDSFIIEFTDNTPKKISAILKPGANFKKINDN